MTCMKRTEQTHTDLLGCVFYPSELLLALIVLLQHCCFFFLRHCTRVLQKAQQKKNGKEFQWTWMIKKIILWNLKHQETDSGSDYPLHWLFCTTLRRQKTATSQFDVLVKPGWQLFCVTSKKQIGKRVPRTLPLKVAGIIHGCLKVPWWSTL